MKWFRFYQEVLNDPKVQSLDGELFKFWVNILCVTSQCDGTLPSHDQIAFYLRVTRDEVDRHMKQLIDRGLIDKGKESKPHNWEKRQYKSDTSAERTRKYREKKKRHSDATCDVTSEVTATPPDTDTDTDTDINKIKNNMAEILQSYPQGSLRQVFYDKLKALNFGMDAMIDPHTGKMLKIWESKGVTIEDMQIGMDYFDIKKGGSPRYPSFYQEWVLNAMKARLSAEQEINNTEVTHVRHGTSYKRKESISEQRERVRRRLAEIAAAEEAASEVDNGGLAV